MEKRFKKLADGKIVLDNVIYDTNSTKRIVVSNPTTGYKIESIKMNEITYYPVGQVKEKASSKKMATEA